MQSSLAIGPRLILEGAKTNPEGFLISASTEEGLRKFIADGGGLLVAQSEGESIRGYLSYQLGTRFKPEHPTTRVTWNDEEAEKEFGARWEAGQFTYVSQLGVAFDANRLGIGESLYRALESQLKTGLVAGAVVRKPICNNASFAFSLKLGFSEKGTLFSSELKGIKNVVSSLLLKTLSG